MRGLTFEIVDQAVSIACKIHAVGAILSPAEKASAPAMIREYIRVLVSNGERNPQKIAQTAVCLVREHEHDPSYGGKECVGIPGCRKAETIYISSPQTCC